MKTPTDSGGNPSDATAQSSGSFSKTFKPSVDIGFGTHILSVDAHRDNETIFHGTLHTENRNLTPAKRVEVPWHAAHKGSYWEFTHDKWGKRLLTHSDMDVKVKRALTDWLCEFKPVTVPLVGSDTATPDMTAPEAVEPKPAARPPKVPKSKTPKASRSMVQQKPTPSAQVGDELLPSTARLFRIPVHLIRPNPIQPRKEFNERDQQDLEASMAKDGQNTPIEVIFDPEGDPKAPYKLLKGERRWRSAVARGEAYLDGIIRTRDQIPNAAAEHLWCLIGDYHLTQYSKIDLVHSICYQHKEGGQSLKELASLFRRSISWVEMHYQLGSLHPDLLKRLDKKLTKSEQLPMQIATEIARVPPENQIGIYERARKVKGCKLQILEARRLSTEITPRQLKGRLARPADLVKNLLLSIPRMDADARIVEGYDGAVFLSLATHRPAEMPTTIGQVEDAIQRLRTVKLRLEEAARKVAAA